MQCRILDCVADAVAMALGRIKITLPQPAPYKTLTCEHIPQVPVGSVLITSKSWLFRCLAAAAVETMWWSAQACKS